MIFPRRARGRNPGAKRGRMNGMERAWAAELERGVHAGEVLWWKFEGVTLKLADDTRYTPDFVVMLANGDLRCDECKGFMEEAAFVRLKVAAELFPFSFRLIKVKPKKLGGGWEITDLGA